MAPKFGKTASLDAVFIYPGTLVQLDAIIHHVRCQTQPLLSENLPMTACDALRGILDARRVQGIHFWHALPQGASDLFDERREQITTEPMAVSHTSCAGNAT